MIMTRNTLRRGKEELGVLICVYSKNIVFMVNNYTFPGDLLEMGVAIDFITFS